MVEILNSDYYVAICESATYSKTKFAQLIFITIRIVKNFTRQVNEHNTYSKAYQEITLGLSCIAVT